MANKVKFAPEHFKEKVSLFYEKHHELLHDKIGIRELPLKNAIDYVFNGYVNDTEEELALANLEKDWENFTREIEAINDSKEDKFPNFRDLNSKKANQESLKKLMAAISKERKWFNAEYEARKKSGDLDLEKLTYEYAAKEKALIDAEAKKRIEAQPVFRFFEHDLKITLKNQTYPKGPETKVEHKRVKAAREKLGIEPGKEGLRSSPGNIVGVDKIFRELDEQIYKKLEKLGRTKYQKINLELLFEDRFYVFHQQTAPQISIDKSKIREIAEKSVKIIKSGTDKVKTGDEIAKLVMSEAHYERKNWVQKDFKNRLNEEPVDRREEERKKDAKKNLMETFLGPSATSKKEDKKKSKKKKTESNVPWVTALGLTAYTAGKVARNTAQKDTLEYVHSKDKEEKKKAAKKSNAKIIFGTVLSIVGTAVLVDGLLLKGHYTRQLFNGRNGNNNGNSRSL
jgi:hypothetical protein